MILTQRDLIAKLREDLGLRIGVDTLHAMMAKGLPTVPARKKPRFHYESVKAWILAARELEPVAQEARDKVFRMAMRRGA